MSLLPELTILRACPISETKGRKGMIINKDSLPGFSHDQNTVGYN